MVQYSKDTCIKKNIYITVRLVVRNHHKCMFNARKRLTLALFCCIYGIRGSRDQNIYSIISQFFYLFPVFQAPRSQTGMQFGSEWTSRISTPRGTAETPQKSTVKIVIIMSHSRKPYFKLFPRQQKIHATMSQIRQRQLLLQIKYILRVIFCLILHVCVLALWRQMCSLKWIGDIYSLLQNSK
jgi:hypothetical protein